MQTETFHIYCVRSAGKVVYVGQTTDMRQRSYRHGRHFKNCIMQELARTKSAAKGKLLEALWILKMRQRGWKLTNRASATKIMQGRKVRFYCPQTKQFFSSLNQLARLFRISDGTAQTRQKDSRTRKHGFRLDFYFTANGNMVWRPLRIVELKTAAARRNARKRWADKKTQR